MFKLLLLIALGSGWIKGGVTFYYGEFEGRTLGCYPYKYEKATGPWVAVDVSWFRTGKVECGDWAIVQFPDGEYTIARILDSGYLAENKVWDSGLPFVADFPKYWRNGHETGTGRIYIIRKFRYDLIFSKYRAL